METFAINRRKFAKTVFVVFFSLFWIFCAVYATFSVINLLKIKDAFELTFSQMSKKWSGAFSGLPLPSIEPGSSYSFDIHSPSDETKKIVATYTPGENIGIGDISFINSNGGKANLYDVIGLISGFKEETGIQASYVFDSKNAVVEKSVECFSANEKTRDIFPNDLSFVFEDGFAVPETNNIKLGYNVLRMLTSGNIKPGKAVSVFLDSKELKARKYSVLLKKDQLGDFVENITTDGSVENNALVDNIKNIFLNLLHNCQGDKFIISTVLHNGKVVSLEFETPPIFDDLYLFSIMSEEEGEVFAKLRNMSKNQNVMHVSAKCDDGEVSISYINIFPKIKAEAETEENKVKINFSGQNNMKLNLIAQKRENSYDMEFYKDRFFSKPPFLNVYITKNK